MENFRFSYHAGICLPVSSCLSFSAIEIGDCEPDVSDSNRTESPRVLQMLAASFVSVCCEPSVPCENFPLTLPESINLSMMSAEISSSEDSAVVSARTRAASFADSSSRSQSDTENNSCEFGFFEEWIGVRSLGAPTLLIRLLGVPALTSLFAADLGDVLVAAMLLAIVSLTTGDGRFLNLRLGFPSKRFSFLPRVLGRSVKIGWGLMSFPFTVTPLGWYLTVNPFFITMAGWLHVLTFLLDLKNFRPFRLGESTTVSGVFFIGMISCSGDFKLLGTAGDLREVPLRFLPRLLVLALFGAGHGSGDTLLASSQTCASGDSVFSLTSARCFLSRGFKYGPLLPP